MNRHALAYCFICAAILCAAACESEPYDCEPVEEADWGDGCVVDVPYGLSQGIECADLAADDGSCPGLDSPEVEQLESDLVEADESDEELDQRFHGIQCGPIPKSKNPTGHPNDCCYYALAGVRDTRCLD